MTRSRAITSTAVVSRHIPTPSFIQRRHGIRPAGGRGERMVGIERKAHWDSIYSSCSEEGVSWYQRDPQLSLKLIREVAPGAQARVIDVGGGASVLVDRLLELPFENITILDISATALEKAKTRLGTRAEHVDWITADITDVGELGMFDVWHDRAVFHFLTNPEDQVKYVDVARRTIVPGGHLIIASFADDGPKQCSGLDVCRYNAATMANVLGKGFSLVRTAREIHTTPSGVPQSFFYGMFQRQ